MIKNVERLSNGNYRHRYAFEHHLPDNWWYSALEVFSDSPAVARFAEQNPEATLMACVPLDRLNRDLSPAALDQDVVKEWAQVYLTGLTEGLRPYSIFIDMNLLGKDEHGKAAAEIIEAHCMDRGAVALIDKHPRYGWVFHTLYAGDPLRAYKKKISSFFFQQNRKQREIKTERGIEVALARQLRKQGHKVQRQIQCESGIADVVTEEAVYEIKFTLTRSRLFEAIGQVLIYRQAINPNLKAVVLGKPPKDGKIEEIIDCAQRLGVEVQIWKRDEKS
jgi:hypothetical protein